MKIVIKAAAVFVFILGSSSTALAVDTSQTYQSGILVLIFLGVCALIVVAQMVPALMLLYGFISSLAKKRTQKDVLATASNQDVSE